MRITRIVLALLMCLASGCASRRASDPAMVGPPAEPLGVLTYNIHHGEGVDGVLDLERIAALITESGADLVALQEVDERATRSGGVDQAAELARLTGMHHAFAPFMDFQSGRYGLAVLTRYPIDRARAIELPPGKHEPRTALAAEVVVPGHGGVTFVCLHLDWLDDDTERFAQAGALIAALEGEQRVILAGDFNDTPGSRTIGLFESGFTNACKPAGASATFPAGGPEAEIDFVMYRPASAWRGTARVLGETTASDHRPVLARLGWGAESGR